MVKRVVFVKGNVRVITTARALHKGPQDAPGRTLLRCRPLLLNTIPIAHDINRDVVLLQLLGQLDHVLLVCGLTFKWRADKDDDALAEVLVLAVLQRKLRNGNRSGNVDCSADFGGGFVKGLEDLPEVFRVCNQDFWAVCLISDGCIARYTGRTRTLFQP